MQEKKEEEPLLKIDIDNFDTFARKGNNNNIALNSANIKKEIKKQKYNISHFASNEKDNKFNDNIFKLILIIILIASLFFFKNKLIYLKHNYLSNSSLFYFNVFYSDAKYNFLMFIILVCCFTISSGFKLLLLQILSYLLSFTIIFLKNKIKNQNNIFAKNLVVFHSCDIFISFLYLGEKLIQIYEDNSYHVVIQIVILFLNYNALIYFTLVEIINCKYDDIIIDIIWGLLIIIPFYYSIFYILKIKIFPKKIIFFLIRNIISTFFICLSILVFGFVILLYMNKLEYFFINKIMMKICGFLAYLIFELYYIFRDKQEKQMKYFTLYNIYNNAYLYSKTTKLKLFIRVSIMILIEYFLLYKFDISYNLNMGKNKCFLIIMMDIMHAFVVMFIIKYIFNLIDLNNTELLENDSNSPFMRYGSFSNLNDQEAPPLIFE